MILIILRIRSSYPFYYNKKRLPQFEAALILTINYKPALLLIYPQLGQQVQVIKEILLFYNDTILHAGYRRTLDGYSFTGCGYAKKLAGMFPCKYPVFCQLVALAEYIGDGKGNIGEPGQVIGIGNKENTQDIPGLFLISLAKS